MATRLIHGTAATLEQRGAPDHYPVNDCYLSLQGEGSFTGVPMVFLRLQGCPVGCPWCDTQETWVVDEARRAPLSELARGKNALWTMMPVERIVAEVRQHAGPHVRRVCITGGEPAVYDLAPLVEALGEAGFTAHIETSGTHRGVLNDTQQPPVLCGSGVWLTVSPKYDMPGGLPVLDDVLAAADEIKLVVGRVEDLERAHALSRQYGAHLLWLQPVSLSPKATTLCVEACKANGWNLSVQVHQYLTLP